jgi:hypothetical protein
MRVWHLSNKKKSVTLRRTNAHHHAECKGIYIESFATTKDYTFNDNDAYTLKSLDHQNQTGQLNPGNFCEASMSAIWHGKQDQRTCKAMYELERMLNSSIEDIAA